MTGARDTDLGAEFSSVVDFNTSLARIDAKCI
jgi:hypothetical protein